MCLEFTNHTLLNYEHRNGAGECFDNHKSFLRLTIDIRNCKYLFCSLVVLRRNCRRGEVSIANKHIYVLCISVVCRLSSVVCHVSSPCLSPSSTLLRRVDWRICTAVGLPSGRICTPGGRGRKGPVPFRPSHRFGDGRNFTHFNIPATKHEEQSYIFLVACESLFEDFV